LCKEQERLLITGHRDKDDDEYRPVESDELQAKLAGAHEVCSKEYEIRRARVAERNELKRKAHDAKVERRQGPKLDVERFVLLKGATPFYETANRTLLHSAVGPGCTTTALRKMLQGALERGPEFTHGSTAGMVLRTSASYALSKAVQMWRRDLLETRVRAYEQAELFMATATREHLAQLPWSLEVCKTIFLGSRELPQPAGPSLEPFDKRPARCQPKAEVGGVEAVAANLKKAWKTNGFSLTIARQASGEVKLTVWAVNQKFRQEYYNRRERLRKTYGIGGPTGESLHATVAEGVLGQGGISGGGQRIRGEQIFADAVSRGDKPLPQFRDTYKEAPEDDKLEESRVPRIRHGVPRIRHDPERPPALQGFADRDVDGEGTSARRTRSRM